MKFKILFILIMLLQVITFHAQEQKIKIRPNINPHYSADSFIINIEPYDKLEINNTFKLNRELTMSSYKTSFSRLKSSPYTKFVLPAGLIAYGVIAKHDNSLQSLDREIHKGVTNNISGGTYIDDYLRYVPSVAVYGLHLLGVKSKNNYRDQTFIMLASHILSDFTVGKIKKLSDVQRPDGGPESFPSSHTAFAFVGAHILFKEYHETSPWISVAGYLTASTTGIMRLMNQKHWASDVLAGAGVSILCVELSYLLLPVFHKAIGVNTKSNLFVSPVIGDDTYGLGLAYLF